MTTTILITIRDSFYEIPNRMKDYQERLCSLLADAIEQVAVLLANGEDREKIIRLVNTIKEPSLRRIVLIETELIFKGRR